jgi:hypothetical protein
LTCEMVGVPAVRDVPRFCAERNSVARTKMMSRAWELLRDGPAGTILDMRCVEAGGTLVMTWGDGHFRHGFQADVRNLFSQLLARIGNDRYYAAPVGERRSARARW